MRESPLVYFFSFIPYCFSANLVSSKSWLLHASTVVQILVISYLNYSTFLTRLPAFDFGLLHSILWKAVLIVFIDNSTFVWYLFPPLDCELHGYRGVSLVLGIVGTQYIEWMKKRGCWGHSIHGKHEQREKIRLCAGHYCCIAWAKHLGKWEDLGEGTFCLLDFILWVSVSQTFLWAITIKNKAQLSLIYQLFNLLSAGVS